MEADTQSLVRRTAVLAIDTSNSMRGARFEAAKQAARTYLAAVPDDVYVGIVSFADDVVPALAPTQDRQQADEVIDDLTLSRKTRLHDGVLAGVEMAGDEGQRSLLVLSDGADTSRTPVTEATAAVSATGCWSTSSRSSRTAPRSTDLRSIAEAGSGEVISADSDALAETFCDEADVLATQVLVTAELPAEVRRSRPRSPSPCRRPEGDLTHRGLRAPCADRSAPSVAPLERAWAPPGWVLYVGVGAFGLGLVALLALVVPARSGRPPRASGWRRTPPGRARAPTADTGDAPLAQATRGHAGRAAPQPQPRRADHPAPRRRRQQAEVLRVAAPARRDLPRRRRGRTAARTGRPRDRDRVPDPRRRRPWVYLGFQRSRRRKAFDAALPDTLQLMSGSLAAGLSLTQSVDTIVREGAEPVAGEFHRVLVETRLGVSLENALEGVAERFDSRDFDWVVMAIRIQRQVGGNLAELLDTVGATMREREYLRRQVARSPPRASSRRSCSPCLPPGFLLYLLVAQRDYVMPLFTDVRGLIMLLGRDPVAAASASSG